MTRVSVPAMDELIGRKFPVLDDGFVYVVDYMGSDRSIVADARQTIDTEGRKLSDDRSLIRHLIRKNELGPLEQAELKLQIRVPMDTWRQWIRYRTAHVQEYSTRYSEAIDSAQKTAPDAWRLQSQDNKQGSGGLLTEWPPDANKIDAINFAYLPEDVAPGQYLSERERMLQGHARKVYEERLQFGVAKEQARKDLPLSTYTSAIWKIDVRNLLHAIQERKDSHSQLEIRSYFNVIGDEIVAKWLPLVWEAFQDYRLNAMSLSGPEIAVLRKLLEAWTYNKSDLEVACAAFRLGNREKSELKDKLNVITVGF